MILKDRKKNDLYNEAIQKELIIWEKQITRRSGLLKSLSRTVQSGINSLTPKKVQDLITSSIKANIKLVLHGSSKLTHMKIAKNATLAESDYFAYQSYRTYSKVAIAQGIGFGLGGLLINIADLPALLTIQVKFLFDCCKTYGYDPDIETERLFILYVFQLAYASNERRAELLPIIKNWKSFSRNIKPDWERLQMEYRDYMDIAKLMQLLPIVGAVAGGVANHNLMETLRETAMNAYRLRRIRDGE